MGQVRVWGGPGHIAVYQPIICNVAFESTGKFMLSFSAPKKANLNVCNQSTRHVNISFDISLVTLAKSVVTPTLSALVKKGQ